MESKTNKVVSLERDPKFQKDLNDTLHNIKRFRGFKDRTWGRLQELHQQMENEKGELGMLRGKQAR